MGNSCLHTLYIWYISINLNLYTKFFQERSVIMIKKLRFTILILLSIAIGSAVYLHHHNRLAKYSPELDRLIVDLDRQVSVAWEATSRLRTIMTETAPKLFPLEKLQKYIPKSDAPERFPKPSTRGSTIAASGISAPRSPMTGALGLKPLNDNPHRSADGHVVDAAACRQASTRQDGGSHERDAQARFDIRISLQGP